MQRRALAAFAFCMENLSAYRRSPREQSRIKDLLGHAPTSGTRALDVGARDGYLSRLLARRFEHVVALDLEPPPVRHPRVQPLLGDARALAFHDRTFDFV